MERDGHWPRQEESLQPADKAEEQGGGFGLDNKRDSGRARESRDVRAGGCASGSGGKEGLGQPETPAGQPGTAKPRAWRGPPGASESDGLPGSRSTARSKAQVTGEPLGLRAPGTSHAKEEAGKLIQLRRGPGLAQTLWDQRFELHHPRDSPGHWRRLSAQGQLKGKPRTEGPAAEQSEGCTLAVSA